VWVQRLEEDIPMIKKDADPFLPGNNGHAYFSNFGYRSLVGQMWD
jgi:hypothetical protein